MVEVYGERKMWMTIHRSIEKDAIALKKRISSTKSPRVFERLTMQLIEMAFYIQSENYEIVCDYALRDFPKERRKLMKILRG